MDQAAVVAPAAREEDRPAFSREPAALERDWRPPLLSASSMPKTTRRGGGGPPTPWMCRDASARRAGRAEEAGGMGCRAGGCAQWSISRPRISGRKSGGNPEVTKDKMTKDLRAFSGETKRVSEKREGRAQQCRRSEDGRRRWTSRGPTRASDVKTSIVIVRLPRGG